MKRERGQRQEAACSTDKSRTAHRQTRFLKNNRWINAFREPCFLEQIRTRTKVTRTLAVALLDKKKPTMTWPESAMVQLSWSHDRTSSPDTWTIISEKYLWPQKQGHGHKATSWSNISGISVKIPFYSLSAWDSSSLYFHCTQIIFIGKVFPGFLSDVL